MNNTEEVKHSPLPFSFSPAIQNKQYASQVWDEKKWSVCILDGVNDAGTANAKFIVEACNNYYAQRVRIEELEREREQLRLWVSRLSLSMAAHPDCVKGSEFYDYVSGAEKVLESALQSKEL